MRLLLFALLLSSLIFSEFVLRDVEMEIGGIQKDGSAHVKESVRFLVIGDYEKSLYESGFDRNDLAFWANITRLGELKLHVNPQRVAIRQSDFAVRPQPLRGCNAALNLCQGEIVLEYSAQPFLNESNGEQLSGTGLFSVEFPKPRTTRYVLNPSALAFLMTDQGDLRLEQDIYLTLRLPPNSIIESEEDLNPKPNGLENARFPISPSELQWTDMVLVKLGVAFTVEESLDQEVVDFFAGVFQQAERRLRGEQGIAIALIALVLVGGYLYLQKAKQR